MLATAMPGKSASIDSIAKLFTIENFIRRTWLGRRSRQKLVIIAVMRLSPTALPPASAHIGGDNIRL